MKTCIRCAVKRDLGSFYKHKGMADGHLNVCIDCTKARVIAHRNANIDRIREYDKQRGKTEKRKLASKQYFQTEAGKQSRAKAVKRWRENNPLKYAAHILLNNALRSGSVVKQSNCALCWEQTKVEAHHEDYTKPLDVLWLCSGCHSKAHKSKEIT